MTTEKTKQKDEHEEQPASMDCCSPQMFKEMMAKCGPMTQEMMKGCCQPKQK